MSLSVNAAVRLPNGQAVSVKVAPGSVAVGFNTAAGGLFYAAGVYHVVEQEGSDLVMAGGVGPQFSYAYKWPPLDVHSGAAARLVVTRTGVTILIYDPVTSETILDSGGEAPLIQGTISL